MSPNELNALLRRRPYLPIRLHVSDGVQYDIFQPEMAVVGMSVLFLGQRRNVQSEFFDEPVLIALRHITRVEPIIESTTAN